MALVKKGILVNHYDFCCAFCFMDDEDIDHLFFNCRVSTHVRKIIFKWLNVDFIPFVFVCTHFTSFGALLKNIYETC
jgi:hypothetical protein